METWKKSFSHVSNGKYFEKLFTLTLKGSVASDWYVSFASVIHYARLPDRLRRMQRNKARRNKENRNKKTFSKVRHRYDNPVACLDCARVRKSIIYVTMCKQKQKPPSPRCSAAKHPKYNKTAVTDMREKSVNFFNGTAWLSTLALEITLLTWVPLQKFPFL